MTTSRLHARRCAGFAGLTGWAGAPCTRYMGPPAAAATPPGCSPSLCLTASMDALARDRVPLSMASSLSTAALLERAVDADALAADVVREAVS
jgi:hypothetical protein